MLRMTQNNWKRFESHNKKTTIRTHELKTGEHSCGSGSFQWNSWKQHGYVYVHPYIKKCKVKELTESDARDDGFDSLCELLLELARLNREITAETIVFKHPVEKFRLKGDEEK